MVYTHLKLRGPPVCVEPPLLVLRDIPALFHFRLFPTQCNRVVFQEGIEGLMEPDLLIFLWELVQMHQWLFRGKDSTMVTMAGRLFGLMNIPFSRQLTTGPFSRRPGTT